MDLRLVLRGMRERSGKRDLSLYLNRLSTGSWILHPIFTLISRSPCVANPWAIDTQIQIWSRDRSQVNFGHSAWVAKDLAFCPWQSDSSAFNLFKLLLMFSVFPLGFLFVCFYFLFCFVLLFGLRGLMPFLNCSNILAGGFQERVEDTLLTVCNWKVPSK